MLGIMCFVANAQNITGKVRAKSTGDPLVGASILVKGTKTNTLTDATGSFSIAAEKGATLLVSYVGFSTLTIKINSTNTVDVQMIELDKDLNEVVVIG